MVISESKPIEEILGFLNDKNKVVILGCSECATACKTGGEEEIENLKNILEKKDIKTLNSSVLTTSCNDLLTKRELRDLKEDINDADIVISLACGNGVQTLAKLLDKQIVPGNNTLFVGEKIRNGIFEENCRTCGECLLGRTAGICPVTKCSKGLLNGPCGGSKDGKCEVDNTIDCAWINIFNQLKELDKLYLLEEISPIRSYKSKGKQQKLNTRRH